MTNEFCERVYDRLLLSLLRVVKLCCVHMVLLYVMLCIVLYGRYIKQRKTKKQYPTLLPPSSFPYHNRLNFFQRKRMN